MARMGSSKAGRRVRRQFTEEFKAGAVRLVLDEERTVGAVARELDQTPSALAGWVHEARLIFEKMLSYANHLGESTPFLVETLYGS